MTADDLVRATQFVGFGSSGAAVIYASFRVARAVGRGEGKFDALVEKVEHVASALDSVGERVDARLTEQGERLARVEAVTGLTQTPDEVGRYDRRSHFREAVEREKGDRRRSLQRLIPLQSNEG